MIEMLDTELIQFHKGVSGVLFARLAEGAVSGLDWIRKTWIEPFEKTFQFELVRGA